MKSDKFYTAAGGDFHYLDWGGRGPAAHIGHATGFCAKMYAPLAQRLTPRLRMLGLDDRGHGLTQAEADPKRLKTWQTFTDDLGEFFEYIGEPVIAMGHSKGGVAAMMLAAHRPDLVKALILIDPTILPFSWAMWTWAIKAFNLGRRIPIAARAAKRRNGFASLSAVDNAYRGQGIFKTWQDGFLEGYLEDGFKSDGNGGVKLACDPAWEAQSFASFCPYAFGYVKRLSVPTLVLYGAKSDIFFPAAAHRFQRLAPEAHLVRFEDAGHFVPMEKPDETANEIISFLERRQIINADNRPEKEKQAE